MKFERKIKKFSNSFLKVNKFSIGILSLGSVAGILASYLLRQKGSKIISVLKSETDRNKISRNPMQAKRKQYAYSVCILRQEKNFNDFKKLNEFCRNKWFFNKK